MSAKSVCSDSLFFANLRLRTLRLSSKFNKHGVQTLRHKSSDFACQNNYLFAGKKLYENSISCEVIDDKKLYDISDHNPLIAEFKI